MTLDERLCLARAGYSAQDIAQFEQGENFAKKEPEGKPAESAKEPEGKPAEPAKEPEGKPAEPAQDADKAPAWAIALEQSIKALTAAQQAHNVKFDDMGEPVSVEQAALDALDNVYNGGKK